VSAYVDRGAAIASLVSSLLLQGRGVTVKVTMAIQCLDCTVHSKC
jgi:hypothetical protein